MLRIGRGRLLRNAAVVLGNRGGPQAAEILRRSLEDPDPLVRDHVAWALTKIGV
jgi:epoxyqueuosine reductase